MRINTFGHLGYGNVHYNLSSPIAQRDFLELDSKFAIKLGQLTTMMTVNFAAKHGIGRVKVELAVRLKDLGERKLVVCLKKALDEDNNLNPSVLVSTRYG